MAGAGLDRPSRRPGAAPAARRHAPVLRLHSPSVRRGGRGPGRRAGRAGDMGAAGPLAATLLLAASSLAAEERFAFSRSAMGTTVRIVMYASGSATELADRAFAEIDAVENALSDYRATSDVTRLRAAAGGKLITVSPITSAAL